MRHLPCGFPQAAIRRAMRELPHRARLARQHAGGARSLESISASRRARYGNLRCVPQRRGHRGLHRTQRRMHQLPHARLSDAGGGSSGRGFGTTCQNCHGVMQWQVAHFDHARFTRFALTGVHQSLACANCHTGGRYQGTPADCFSCHVKDFTNSTNPNHVAAGFPQDCSQCHTTASWATTNFNHNLTKFPLTGGHVSVACATCHVNNQFANLNSACVNCHLKDMQGDHESESRVGRVPAGLLAVPHHRELDQRDLRSQRDQVSADRQAHSVACATCHVNNQFATLSTACVNCHLKDMQGTTNPNHVVGRIPAGLLAVPHHRELDQRDLRSQRDQVPADRQAHQRVSLRQLPREQSVRDAEHRLRQLPPEGHAGDHESESRRGRVPAGLLAVPLHGRLDRRQVRSQYADQVRAHRRARFGRLRRPVT